MMQTKTRDGMYCHIKNIITPSYNNTQMFTTVTGTAMMHKSGSQLYFMFF
jgi:hypothetical protein